ncbi:MAG: hypothetical protein ACTSRG_21400, partial [Candidatus Helarchaeota archaeon]
FKINIILIYIEINNIWFIQDYGILSNSESFILYNTLKKFDILQTNLYKLYAPISKNLCEFLK